MSGLDINVGDIVQIRSCAKYFAGCVGKIIGIRLATANGEIDHDMFLYTVQFTSKAAEEFDAGKLTIIRSTVPHESGRKDISYEKR